MSKITESLLRKMTLELTDDLNARMRSMATDILSDYDLDGDPEALSDLINSVSISC